MKGRERRYMKIKYIRFAKLIYYYDVTKSLSEKEKIIELRERKERILMYKRMWNK